MLKSTFFDVLHVEDDDGWSDLVGHWLSRRGISVKRVRSRGEFEKAVLSSPPRCFLLDVNLDGEDGLALCDRIKLDAALQSIPVVIHTAGKATTLDCVTRQAVLRVEKRHDGEAELCAVIESVLMQQERSQGVIDAGDLRLDPRDGGVIVARRKLATLDAGSFAALALLIRSAPKAVPDDELYKAFLSRGAYRQKDPEITPRQVVRTYVSKLRSILGPKVGSRLVWVKNEDVAGYAYRSISN